ncbi:MAG: hypothetical protein FWG33_05075, partial [Oscillospiraceae bacterium]|nr:hypothetical protein [Oscillospiraceae bacterium]
SLTILQQHYPSADIYFMLGSDQLGGLIDWHNIKELLNSFHMLLLVRAEDDIEAIFAALPWLCEYRNRFILSYDHPRSNLSSSTVRKRVAAGESIRYLTESKIIDYIAQNGLYRHS